MKILTLIMLTLSLSVNAGEITDKILSGRVYLDLSIGHTLSQDEYIYRRGHAYKNKSDSSGRIDIGVNWSFHNALIYTELQHNSNSDTGKPRNNYPESFKNSIAVGLRVYFN